MGKTYPLMHQNWKLGLLCFYHSAFKQINHVKFIVFTKIIDEIPKEPKSCLIFGGEPTVRVLGKGTGGRNEKEKF